MSNNICIITGANSGIGKATALGLAKMGAHIVMVCRSEERGLVAQEDIKTQSGNQSIDLLLADLSSQQEIRDLVTEFKQKYSQLHVLINNAGIILPKRTFTVDGIETVFAVNHLAPFLLTNLLLDVLKASAPARIITVSSRTHSGKIDFDNLQMEKRFSLFKSYGQSKLGNILFTYELARRLDGTGVTANCLHPGGVRTNFGKDLTGIFRIGMIVAGRFLKSPKKGARTSIYLASSPDVEGVTGKYFMAKKEVKSSKISYDESVAKRLWDISAELVKLKQD
ncbi:MAG: SDR family oxidoreductase [Candidatus Helarchaeota archaeon]|nr:SDR family oxidoreductase [Candidatus Helarchaeota archaeon]